MATIRKLRPVGWPLAAAVAILGAATAGRPALAQAPSAGRQLRVYHIGNSLTASILPDRLHELMALRGMDYQFGSQLAAGTSLARHADYRASPEQTWGGCFETDRREGGRWRPGEPFHKQPPFRFGRYDDALPGHTWDVLALQPYESPLGEELAACVRFIELARQKSPQVKVLLVAAYPRRFARAGGVSTVDYAGSWGGPYDYALDDVSHAARYSSMRRAYFLRLRDLLRERFPDTNVSVAWLGESLLEVDRAIRAERLPGLAALAAREPKMVPGWSEGPAAQRGANVLYADNFHLNPLPHREPTLGIYAVAMTLFAALTGESPVGLPGRQYGLDDRADAELIRAIQQIAEKVTTAGPDVVPPPTQRTR